MGNVHHLNGEGLSNMNEFQCISGIIYGEKNESSVHSDATSESIFDIKGLLSFLFLE